MGKRRHVRAKSKLKFGKKKLRENRGHLKCILVNDEDEECDKTSQIRKESIWRKWLTFFREHWVLRKSRTFTPFSFVRAPIPQDGGSSASEKAHSTSSTEISAEPEPEVSEIFQRTTKKSSQVHKEDEEDPQTRKATTSEIDQNDGKVENVAKRCTLSDLMKIKNNSDGNSFSTSALFVRFNLKQMDDSTNSVESTLSTNFTHSGHSLKSSKNLRTQVYGRAYEKGDIGDVNEERNGSTFKTISEPSWNEKHKMFQQQKLQENLNNLIEQFMFLESDDLESNKFDLASLSNFQNKLGQDTTRLRLNAYTSTIPLSVTDNELALKDASREVSPQILVNIKPFKEYMSRRYANSSMPNKVGTVRKTKKADAIQNELVATETQTNQTEVRRIRGRKAKMYLPEEKAVVDELGRRKRAIGTTGLRLLDEKCNTTAKKMNLEGSDQMKKPAFIEDAPKGFNYILTCDLTNPCEANECCSEFVFEEPETRQKRALCSVWGIYKSYVDLEGLVQTTNRVKSESLEDVLDDFDDKNHGAIFKKNMNQFKKQISFDVEPEKVGQSLSVPLVDLLEVKFAGSPAGREKAKGAKTGNVAPVIVLQESSRSQSKWQCIDQVKLERSLYSKKFLDNYFFVVYESSLSSGMLASRVEILFVETSQKSKEVSLMKETNFGTLIEKMVPQPEVDVVHVIAEAEVLRFDVPDASLVPVLSSLQSNVELAEETKSNETETAQICEEGPCPAKFHMRLNDCFYFTDFDRFHSDLLNSFVQTTSTSAEPQVTQPKLNCCLQPNVLALSLNAMHQVVQIFNDASYNFVVEMHDNKSVLSSFLLTPSRGMSLSSVEFTRTATSKAKIPISNSEKLTGFSFKKESFGYDAILDICFKNGMKGSHELKKVWTNNLIENEDKKALGKLVCDKEDENWPVDLRKDGFQILYAGLFKKGFDEYEDGQSMNGAFDQTFGLRYRTTSELLKETEIPQKISLPENTANQNDRLIFSQIQFLSDGNSSRIIKYKGDSSGTKDSSSPGDNSLPPKSEHRLKRFLHIASEIEKTEYPVNGKKKRMLIENGVEIRRTGSTVARKGKAYLGSIYIREGPNGHVSKAKSQVGSDWRNVTVGPHEVVSGEGSKASWLLLNEKATGSEPQVAQVPQGAQSKESVRICLFEKSRKTMTRDLVAAINSIRGFDQQSEENSKGTKRMSLVILLSKNK